MTKQAITWMFIVSALSLTLGAAGGAEYVMRKVDALDAQRQAREQEIAAHRLARDQEIAAENNKFAAAREEGVAKLELDLKNSRSAEDLLGAGFATCRQQFSEGTLLYETPAVAQVSIGLRSVLGMPVNQTPGANVAPRWWIPAKIKPQVYGEAHGAIYYYVSTDNRIDGPYLPGPVTGNGGAEVAR